MRQKDILFTSARNTGDSSRDCWETPEHLFVFLDRLFGFELDVCAVEATAKCARYFSPEDDALSQVWAPHVCWMNPPYSNLEPWLRKAWTEAQAGAVVVALVPPRLDAAYWSAWANRADRRVELQGRVQFIPPPEGSGEKPKADRNPHPSTILLFDPKGRFSRIQLGVPAPPVFSWEWRPDTEALESTRDAVGFLWTHGGWFDQMQRCEVCESPLKAGHRPEAVYCSSRCRVAAWRGRKRNGSTGRCNG